MAQLFDFGASTKVLKPIAYLVLILGILVLGGALVLIVGSIRQEIKGTQTDLRSTVARSASQTDYELLAFIDKLSLRHDSPEQVSHDDLIDDFDILLSRIEGSVSDGIHESETAMPEALAMLNRLKPLVLAFRPGDIGSFRRIRDELRTLSKVIRPPAPRAFSLSDQAADTQRQRLRTVLWQMISIFSAILLCAAVLVAMIVVDKTKAQRLRDELESRVEERTRELKRSNQELEQFAYVASHDLQEPLRKILGFCELLEPQLEGRLDREEEEFFGYVTDAAKRMQHLIRDLLTFSRLGRQEMKRELVDCGQVLDTVIEDLALAIDEGKARIAYRDLPRILGDRDQLTQLFSNLIGNSVKYRADEPPEIVISAQRIQNQVQFSVRDNGLGFEPKFAERIFRTFQRLHPREDYEGTGIGLAICKQVVERHGGRIWADALPGKGSTFWFTVPGE